MNRAVNIIIHSVRLLLHAPARTLRVLAPALLVQALAIAAMIAVMQRGVDLMASDETLPTAELTGDFWAFMALSLVAGIGAALMAILWHRHVLLDPDEPGGSNGLEFLTIVRYIWRVILLALIQTLALLPLALVATFVTSGIFSAAGDEFAAITVTTIVATLVALVAIWLGLRLGLVLPAAALNTPLRIGESWTETSMINRTLWWIALIMTVALTAIGLVTGLLSAQENYAASILELILQPIYALISASVLTTLYGSRIMGLALDSD